MMLLFEHTQKRELEKIKVNAKIAGATFEDEKKSDFKFKDPKDYDNMTPEEREIATKKMMHFYSTKGIL